MSALLLSRGVRPAVALALYALRAGLETAIYPHCKSRQTRVGGAVIDEQLLATVLRDLSGVAAVFEQNPTDEHRKALHLVGAYAERVLEEFVKQEGDIRPRYLEGEDA